MLTSLIENEIDVLLLSETKLDETFPLEQFLISGFAKLLRLDTNWTLIAEASGCTSRL